MKCLNERYFLERFWCSHQIEVSWSIQSVGLSYKFYLHMCMPFDKVEMRVNLLSNITTEIHHLYLVYACKDF